MNSWLAGQAQVVIGHEVLSGCQPASRFPQVSILGPVLFIVFTNYLDIAFEGILNNSADSKKLPGSADCLDGRVALQRDHDNLEGSY